MRGLTFLTAALLAAPTIASAQVGRPDARAADWRSDAPQVRVWIAGARAFDFGDPVPVHYWVGDDAYVVVAAVDGNGRLTILSPTRRTGRTFVRGSIEHVLLGRRMPAARQGAFPATGGVLANGFVFAIASWQPFDLSSFERRDFDAFGLESRFSLANRALAAYPDRYIDRFAAQATWDANAPYDYDVDYYGSSAASPFASASSLCFGGSRTAWLWSDWYGNPYAGMCPGYFNSLALCYGFSVFSASPYCGFFYRPARIASLPATPGGSTGPDTTKRANIGVIRSGLWAPDTVGVIADEPAKGAKKPGATAGAKASALAPFGGRRTSEPTYFAIPERGLQTLKRSAASREPARGAAVGGGVADAKRAAKAGEPKALRPPPRRDDLRPPPRVKPERAAPRRPAGATSRDADRRGPPVNPRTGSGARETPRHVQDRPSTRETPAARPATRGTGDVRQGAGAAKGGGRGGSAGPKKPPA